jgi:hypothetical protein
VTTPPKASSAVTVMLKAIPAVGVGVDEATEKCVATGGGGGGAPAPHPLSIHKPQIEISSNRDFFMTPSQAFEAFLAIRSYLHMRGSGRKSIMAKSFLLRAGLPSGTEAWKGRQCIIRPRWKGSIAQAGYVRYPRSDPFAGRMGEG